MATGQEHRTPSELLPGESVWVVEAWTGWGGEGEDGARRIRSAERGWFRGQRPQHAMAVSRNCFIPLFPVPKHAFVPASLGELSVVCSLGVSRAREPLGRVVVS